MAYRTIQAQLCSLTLKYIVTIWGDYRRGFGLDIGSIDHLYTQI
jgi:hypothetical protein